MRRGVCALGHERRSERGGIAEEVVGRGRCEHYKLDLIAREKHPHTHIYTYARQPSDASSLSLRQSAKRIVTVWPGSA